MGSGLSFQFYHKFTRCHRLSHISSLNPSFLPSLKERDLIRSVHPGQAGADLWGRLQILLEVSPRGFLDSLDSWEQLEKHQVK